MRYIHPSCTCDDDDRQEPMIRELVRELVSETVQAGHAANLCDRNMALALVQAAFVLLSSMGQDRRKIVDTVSGAYTQAMENMEGAIAAAAFNTTQGDGRPN